MIEYKNIAAKYLNLLKEEEVFITKRFNNQYSLIWEMARFPILKLKALHDIVDVYAFGDQDLTSEKIRKVVYDFDLNSVVERDRIYLIGRIDNWKERIESLYSEVEQWICEQNDDNVKIHKSSITQGKEELMAMYNIEPRELPTFTILKGKNKWSFVPSALWVIGANGKINFTTNSKQYYLVDCGERNVSKWMMSEYSLKPKPYNFTKQILMELLEA
jgi:hypothetical protein